MKKGFWRSEWKTMVTTTTKATTQFSEEKLIEILRDYIKPDPEFALDFRFDVSGGYFRGVSVTATKTVKQDLGVLREGPLTGVFFIS